MRAIRTIIQEVTDGVPPIAKCTGEFGEIIEGVEIIQQVGFASIPKAGHAGLLIVDGNRAYLIATDNDNRPRLDSDNRAFYFDQNNYIKFEVVADLLTKIEVVTEKDVDVQATGNVTVSGAAVTVNSTVVTLGLIASGFVTLLKSTFLGIFNLHVHTGVTSGGSDSGPPKTAAGPENSTINTLAS